MSVDDVRQRLLTFRAKLRASPTNGHLWLQYGDFLDEDYDRPDETVHAYEQAAEFLPEKDLRLRLGSAHANAGRLQEGVALIRESLSEKPRVEGFCFLADAYLQHDKYEEAEQACREAILLDPGFEEAYYLLGQAVRDRSKPDAIKCYRKAVELDPDYALAWQALGRDLAASDETLSEAVSALRRAIDLNPEDGWAMAFLANASWRLKRYEEAHKWFRMAIDTFPEYEQFKKSYCQFKRDPNSIVADGS